jgi:hypothetical protein
MNPPALQPTLLTMTRGWRSCPHCQHRTPAAAVQAPGPPHPGALQIVLSDTRIGATPKVRSSRRSAALRAFLFDLRHTGRSKRAAQTGQELSPPGAGDCSRRNLLPGTPRTRRRASCLARGPRTFPVPANGAAFRSDLPRLCDRGRSRSLRRPARRGGLRSSPGSGPPDPDPDRRRGARSGRARTPAQRSVLG